MNEKAEAMWADPRFQLLADLDRLFGSNKVWGGMEWVYYPILPEKYRPVAERIRSELGKLYAEYGVGMNERIEKLIAKSKLENLDGFAQYESDGIYNLAELIIQECYEHCKDQLMDKKLAEEAGLDYNDGVMDCAIGLKQHFGVE